MKSQGDYHYQIGSEEGKLDTNWLVSPNKTELGYEHEGDQNMWRKSAYRTPGILVY